MSSSRSLVVRANAPVAPRTAGLVMGVWTALLWVIELVDQLLRGTLDALGIRSWSLDSLGSVFVAPFLHGGWAHLLANTVPFAVLGFLVLLGGTLRAVSATVIVTVVSGLFAWLLNPPNTLTIGASGLIFGWLSYLLARAVFSRNGTQIVLAIVVFAVYGGVLWGVFPSQAGVSWQAHLGGAVGGVLAAWLLHRRRTVNPAR